MQRDDDGMGRQVEYDQRTHPMRQRVLKMPWHTDDKPFGVSQKDFEEEENVEPTNQTDGTVQDQPVQQETGETPDDTEPTGRGRCSGASGPGLAVSSGAGASRVADVLDYCFCGRKGKIRLATRWYCQDCWNDEGEALLLDYVEAGVENAESLMNKLRRKR